MNNDFQQDLNKTVKILAHRKLTQRETADKTGKKAGQFMSISGKLFDIVESKDGATLLKIETDKPYPATVDTARIINYSAE